MSSRSLNGNHATIFFEGGMAGAGISTLLGLVIVGFRLVFSRFVLPDYWRLYYASAGSNRLAPFLIHWPAIEYPDVWLALYLALGATILACGIAQITLAWRLREKDSIGEASKTLDYTQIVAGCLLIILCVWYLVHVEPNLSSQPTLVMSRIRGVVHDPAWMRWLLCWKIGIIVLGLGVIWFGIGGLRGQARGDAPIPGEPQNNHRNHKQDPRNVQSRSRVASETWVKR